MNRDDDANIPVLTDIVGLPSATPLAELMRAAPEMDVQGQQLETRAREEWPEEDWKILERRLSERILHQLQGRVDFVLEQRIKDCMAEVLQHALADLSAEIGKGLQETIEKIVTRAVNQELTHIQAQSTLETLQQMPPPWQT